MKYKVTFKIFIECIIIKSHMNGKKVGHDLFLKTVISTQQASAYW